MFVSDLMKFCDSAYPPNITQAHPAIKERKNANQKFIFKKKNKLYFTFLHRFRLFSLSPRELISNAWGRVQFLYH